MKKVIVRIGQAGWTIHFDNDVENFYPFNSNERYRMADFLLRSLGIKVDELLALRKEQMQIASDNLQKNQPLPKYGE